VPHLSSNHIVARSGLRISFDDAPSNCASKSRDTERRRRPNGDLPNAGFPGDVGGVKRPMALLTEAATVTVWWRSTKSRMVSATTHCRCALNEHPYDRAFWEALGKARNWQDADRVARTVSPITLHSLYARFATLPTRRRASPPSRKGPRCRLWRLQS
jgi:hypothetical protein